MLGEATLDVSGTFAGEAIRVLILFAAQQGCPRRSQAQHQDWQSWFRTPFGARLLGATPSGDAAMSAAARPGRRWGAQPATAPIARAMYATARPQTILAARP